MHKCIPTYDACCSTQQPNSPSPTHVLERQPTVVQYGSWLSDVEVFLESMSGCTLEGRRAAELLARRDSIRSSHDRRA